MRLLKGVRPLDYVLAAAFTAGGVFMMYENIAGSAAGLPHPLSTRTWAMVPFFLLVTVPILWRRRNIVGVVGATALATVLHALLFGWVTRCGDLLPLTFALAYAVARFAGSRRDQFIGMTGLLLTQMVLLYRDASIDTVANGLTVALPGLLVFYGIGLIVQNQVSKRREPVAAAPVTAEPVSV
jgi:hypothetical protein